MLFIIFAFGLGINFVVWLERVVWKVQGEPWIVCLGS